MALRLALAGGQDEQPWLWNSSSTTGRWAVPPAPAVVQAPTTTARAAPAARLAQAVLRIVVPVMAASSVVVEGQFAAEGAKVTAFTNNKPPLEAQPSAPPGVYGETSAQRARRTRTTGV